LAVRLAQEKKTVDKKILLIDKSLKSENDRTWSFWSKGDDYFSDIIFHKWPLIRFASHTQNKLLNAAPYMYCMIRGIDFYNYAKGIIQNSPQIDFVQDSVNNILEHTNYVQVETNSNTFTSPFIFNNIPDNIPIAENTKNGEHHFVWQHFKGWFIETPQNAFDSEEAIFMDFRVPQEGDTRFFYVLPTAPNKALVELAIFSPEIPLSGFYDPFLKKYISDILQIPEYIILEEELGAIPMTTFNFQSGRTQRIIPIGTNGGSVKASSGYAYTRIQSHMSLLAQHIIDNKLDTYLVKKNRYDLYDRTMLNAILTDKTQGVKVFDSLFARLDAKTIFKFLDEEGSFLTDLKVFTAPPKWPFIKAFFQEL